MEKLFTTKEVMEMLKISRATLYRYIEKGWLKPVKLGRKTMFTEEELEKFMNKLKSGELK